MFHSVCVCCVVMLFLFFFLFFAEQEDELQRTLYRKNPNKHKITAPSFCKLTTSSTRRCRRWRAAAAASLEALDRRQSPGEREVAERRSRKTYTVERRRGRSTAPRLLLQDLELETPPPSELTTGKTPTAPPQRCEDAGDGGSRSELQRTPTPERGSATCKPNTHRQHLLLQDATGELQTYPYTMYRPRSMDSPASRRRSGRRRQRNPQIGGERGGEDSEVQEIASQHC